MTFLEFVGQHPVLTFLCLLCVCITIDSVVSILANKRKSDD